MDTLDLRPVRERQLSFEQLLSLSELERAEFESIKVVIPPISFDIYEDISKELQLGHVVAKLKKAIYTTTFEHVGSK